MDPFSYLSVLLSIILGLGLTQIFTASGRLIRHRDRARFDWVPLLWATGLLMVYVQVWWAMFGLRAVQHWTFVEFLIVLAQTASLYMMAAVILPEGVDAEGVDLGEYYRRHSGWFFGFFLATLVISVVKDVVISGHLPSKVNLLFHSLLGALCIVGLASGSRRVHQALSVAGAAIIATYIAALFAQLR